MKHLISGVMLRHFTAASYTWSDTESTYRCTMYPHVTWPLQDEEDGRPAIFLGALYLQSNKNLGQNLIGTSPEPQI